jgi:hypothetical protein
MGQGDGRKRPIGDRAQQLVLGPEMMQHRHGVDADAEPKLPHGKAGLALLRQHIEGRIQNGVAVEPVFRAVGVWYGLFSAPTL